MNWLITAEYLLEDSVSAYRFLTQGNNVQVDLDDRELYNQLLAAFDVMNMSDDEVKGECFDVWIYV